MKHVPLLAALSCLCVLPWTFPEPLHARSINCVPDRGCPEGEGPPSCCQPPPCEFVQELKFARAHRDNIAMNMALFQYAEGSDAEAYWADISMRDFQQLLDQASPCPDNPFFKPTPMLEADEDNQCEITFFEDFDQQFGSPSLEDLLENSNTCEELVKAEYEEAKAKREICLVERYRTNPRTLPERMMQALARAQAKVDQLEADQRGYESACTVAPDSRAAQQAVDDELAPLLPDPKSKAKKKKAKRAGKKAGRK